MLGADSITELLADLVRARSVNPPGNEDLAAEVLRGFLDAHGVPATVDYVQPHRPNLIARVGSGQPSVLLTSHLDVVEPGELSRWDRDPFSGDLDGGSLYGRGACDAKGSLAAMAAALVSLAKDPPCEIVLLAVMGEEKGGLGSKHFAAGGMNFDAAVVGEPTQLNIAIGQKGRVGIFLDLVGDAAHPTQASSDVNPVVRLAEVMAFLREFGDEAREGGLGAFVVLGVSAGQEGVLTPPERCSVRASWWFPPTMDHDAAISLFASRLDDFAGRESVPHEIRFHRGAAAYSMDPAHPFVAAAGQCVQGVLGHPPDVSEFPASCDMYVFGREGIPTIVMGPGDIGLAHSPNESIRVDLVLAASRVYVELANAMSAG
ncbi:MAG: M20/M25/M40 family metallo-hydrolase [Candidatus Brocadiia bacterium]|nr:M20/M25/M40 family metallo-hydrolase [Candidatus Brocadiia bacterium]